MDKDWLKKMSQKKMQDVQDRDIEITQPIFFQNQVKRHSDYASPSSNSQILGSFQIKKSPTIIESEEEAPKSAESKEGSSKVWTAKTRASNVSTRGSKKI